MDMDNEVDIDISDPFDPFEDHLIHLKIMVNYLQVRYRYLLYYY